VFDIGIYDVNKGLWLLDINLSVFFTLKFFKNFLRGTHGARLPKYATRPTAHYHTVHAPTVIDQI